MGCYGNIGLMRFNRDLMGIWLGFDRDFMFGKWNFNHPIHGSRKILEIMRLFLELNMGPDRWCTLYHEDIWGLFGFVCPMKCQKRNMNLDMNGTVLGNEIFGLSGLPWLQTNTLPLQDLICPEQEICSQYMIPNREAPGDSRAYFWWLRANIIERFSTCLSDCLKFVGDHQWLLVI